MEMTIKAKCKACGETEMAIIEVGLLSGFTAKEDSLEKLLRNEQIDSYEVTNAMVIMYLKEIREDRESIVSFSAIQEDTVEHISPAVIKIYDYYNRSNNYLTFYNTSGIPKTEAGNDDNQRECVEGRCSKCYYGPGQSELLPIDDFKVKACDPSITFAYMVKALGTDYNSPDFVETTLKIIKVAKKGKVNVWEQMEIIMRRRMTCNCPTFGNNDLFFIYGKDEPQEPNGVGDYYMLPVNSDTYVEPRNAVRHRELINFLEQPCLN
jgi:NADPH-dependent 7-cyano-7-deazaguanine reductase QueF